MATQPNAGSFQKGMHASPVTEFRKGHAPTRAPKPLPVSKEELERLYWVEGLSTALIAKRLNVPKVVQRWMKRLGIRRRPQSSYRKMQLTRERLYDLYVNKRLSAEQIAPLVGLRSGSCVKYWLDKYSILVVHRNYSLKPKISKEALYSLYNVAGYCLADIAKMVGWPEMHIRRCAKFYGLPLAGRGKNERVIKRMAETKRKRWKQDRAYREMMMRALFAARKARPNKAERKLTEMFEKNGLPFQYVGDGKVVLSGLVPDFINTDGQKEIIELFGDYWHGKRATRPTQTEHGRGAIFKRFGFRTLVIWEHELQDENAVATKIKGFTRSRTR